jgi:hypothetical protein
MCGASKKQEPEKEFGDQTNAAMNTMNRDSPLRLSEAEKQSSTDRDRAGGRKARR